MSRSSTPAFNIRRPNIGATSMSKTSSRTGASTPQLGRPTITVEEWEAKCPLSEEMLASIKVVTEKFAKDPLPEKFRNQPEAGPSRTSTPVRRLRNDRASSPAGSRSRTPLQSSKLGESTSSLKPDQNAQMEDDALHPEIITTAQDFQDHFNALTLSTEHEQDSLYRDHLSEIIGLREKCDELVEVLEGGKMEIKEMLKALSFVEERSESLRGACEDLMEEQAHLLTHTSQLAHRLTFFTFLESAQRTLNTPSPTLVLSDEFLPMLKRLDECIAYLSDHRDFKDAELYLIRYEQCLTRSMTLIKIHFVNIIKGVGSEVGRKLYDKTVSDTAAQALLFAKFTSLSSALRPLIQELERRASNRSDELGPLLAECHTAWMSVRSGLMYPRVAEEVGRLDPVGAGLVDLTRAGCGYLKNVCLEEFTLYKSFFLSGETQLYSYLESLCDALYDHLRPRILHETNLEILCGVCTVLQALMVLDVSEMSTEEDDTLYTPYTPSTGSFTPSPSSYNFQSTDDYFGPVSASPMNTLSPNNQRRIGSRQNSGVYNPTTPRFYNMRMNSRKFSSKTLTDKRDINSNGGGIGGENGGMGGIMKRRRILNRLHIEILLRMILQDTQTRLVFRAQAMIRSDVEYYVPRDKDLNYPEKLGEGSKSKKLVESKPNENEVSLDDDDFNGSSQPAFLHLPPPESQEGWYPTLRTTLWVLSCLWTYVDAAVFDDLAQEAIIICCHSLSSASDHIDSLLSRKRKQTASTAPAKEKEKESLLSGNEVEGVESLGMDGKLFLVRHLLILKEMTAGLELGKKVEKRDWGGITEFLKSLLENAGLMLGYNLSTGRTTDISTSDAKTDIDRALKKACEDLIAQCVDYTTSPLKAYLLQATSYLQTHPHSHAPPSPNLSSPPSSSSSPTSDLTSQSFATPNKIKEIHDSFKTQLKPRINAWKGLLLMYLSDIDTVNVLLKPLYIGIEEGYRKYHDFVRSEYDFEVVRGLMTPISLQSYLNENQ